MSEVLRSTAQFLPEIILTAALLLVVLVDATLARWRGRVAHLLAVAGLGAALAYTVAGRGTTAVLWRGMAVLDPVGAFFKLVILAGALILVLAFTFRNARELSGLGPGEFYALLLAATLSCLLLVSANDLVMLYLALEMVSISSYILVGFMKGDRMSNEASLKYLLFGAASTGTMLYGLSLLYGLTGTTSLPAIQASLAAGLSDANRIALLVATVLIIAGFGFKTAAVPFHFWCPDAYEGAPTPVTAYLSVVPKVAGFAILTRFFFGAFSVPLDAQAPWTLYPSIEWPMLLMLVSALTMTVGNVAALTQTNMKRLLAYSSIAHAGYILMGVVALSRNGARGILVYVFAYLFMNLGAFLVVTLVHHHEGTFDLRDYTGLMRRSAVLAVSLAFFLLSLIGIPPLVGFVAKLYVFAAVIEQGSAYYWFAVVGALNAAIAAFYYARVLKAILIDREDEASAQKPAYRVAGLDQLWVIVLVLANLVPVLAWRLVDGWTSAALVLTLAR
jgi:NADH-quinone oxidoreductase subunit N